MNERWGRFTRYGSPEVEERITALVTEAAEACSAALDPATYRAVVLIGGYGRGEGGVEATPGGERPHNNLDFLLIARSGAGDPQALKRKADEALKPLSEAHGIGLDAGVVTDGALAVSPCLVMWHDMRFGHKTLLGDADYVPSLTRFTPGAIVAYDVRNLLVNRGTLLVINDYLLRRRAPTDADRRVMVKHAVKAIIGYGDALLFFRRAYHWSYAEKQRRMQTRTDVAPDFRALYDEAVEFRFRPNYAAYLSRDPVAWMRELRRALAPVHLECEALRLGAEGLTWATYPRRALAHEAFDRVDTLRQIARKVVNVLKRETPVQGLPFDAALGALTAGMAGAMPILFPVIAYDLEDGAYRSTAWSMLSAASTAADDLRAAYLGAWGRYGDVNFGLALERLGLAMEGPSA